MDVEHDPQIAYIRLLINNTNSLLSRNITDLILLDNITGLHVQKDSGNETRDGMQIYRKRFLQGNKLCKDVALITQEEEHLFKSVYLFIFDGVNSPIINYYR